MFPLADVGGLRVSDVLPSVPCGVVHLWLSPPSDDVWWPRNLKHNPCGGLWPIWSQGECAKTVRRVFVFKIIDLFKLPHSPVGSRQNIIF